MPSVLTQEQLAEFRSKLEERVRKQVVDAQENVNWLKETTGAVLTRTDQGTIKAAVYSPLTEREVVTAMFPIDRATDRRYLESLVANIQPKILGAFADDYLHEQLLANIRL